jgi:hypothetical protein
MCNVFHRLLKKVAKVGEVWKLATALKKKIEEEAKFSQYNVN